MPDRNPEFLPYGEDNEARELDTQAARQAETTGRLRYMLAVSLFLALAALVLIYIAFVAT